MGGVVLQSKQPLTLFSRKFNPTQNKYTTMEQEILGIVKK